MLKDRHPEPVFILSEEAHTLLKPHSSGAHQRLVVVASLPPDRVVEFIRKNSVMVVLVLKYSETIR